MAVRKLITEGLFASIKKLELYSMLRVPYEVITDVEHIIKTAE